MVVVVVVTVVLVRAKWVLRKNPAIQLNSRNEEEGWLVSGAIVNGKASGC